MQNQRHPFADILIAFAEGKEIQFRNTNGDYDWVKFNPEYYAYPGLVKNIEWRVKPEIIKQTVWLNIYDDGSKDAICHSTKEHADKCASDSRVACIEVPIEYYHGQGLSKNS